MPKRRARSKGLRLELGDAGIWRAVGSLAGKRIRKSLGTRDEGKAVELKAAFEARLWKRHTYGEEAVRTFEEAALSYLEAGGERRYMPPLLRHFKGRAVASIKPAELRAAAVALYPQAGPATRNRQVIVPGRAVIMHGHDLGWCGAVRVKQFEVQQTERKPVPRDWLEAVMAEADRRGLPHFSAIILFMHQTGARVSEAVRLMGEHVDLSARVAVLERTKTSQWSPRKLTAELVGRIAALEPRPGKPVFGYVHRTSVNHEMDRITKHLGLAKSSPHLSGRHSFATNALAAGASIKDAMDAGDWRSASLFMQTYVHSLEGASKVAALFDAQTGPTDMIRAMSVRRKRSTLGKRK